MAVPHLSDLTWPEAHALTSAGAVAILPVGAVEAHGPHLPLTTDVIIARAMARSAAARFAGDPPVAVILPPVAYTPAPFAAGFSGTLSVSPDTLANLLLDLARAVAAQRFQALAIANAHLDPEHRAALAAAVDRMRAEAILPVAFPDIVRRDLAARLTDEFRSGACHAGAYEGSIILAERPDLVRNEIRETLAPNPLSLSDAIRDGKRTFGDAGGPDAYFGAPADATAEEGRATIEVLGQILEESIREAIR